VHRYENSYKFRVKEYDFFNQKDTIINNKSFSRYKLSSIKPKKIEKNKLGTEYYIIDKLSNFHLPILKFSTAYEEWKKNKNIPYGIFFEKYFIDYYGFLDSREKLVNYWKINKKIVIQKECDYTRQ
jgi:hypothetical protein